MASDSFDISCMYSFFKVRKIALYMKMNFYRSYDFFVLKQLESIVGIDRKVRIAEKAC